MNEYFVGVDGGATKSIITVANQDGIILGSVVAGSANIRISVTKTWEAISSGLTKILQNADLRINDVSLHAVMGLAGVEIKSAHDDFLAMPHRFKSLQLTSDAHIACMGAHAGSDGTIIVIGTGVVGYQIAENVISKVSGWGFPHDDIGGGAWLGLEATKLTIQSLDERTTPSLLTQLIYKHFNSNFADLVAWANQTNSTGFAELAPFVIHAAGQNDSSAINLLQTAAHAINKVDEALKFNHLPVALVGGISPFLEPYLSQGLQKKLVVCKMPPDHGAILMAGGKINNG